MAHHVRVREVHDDGVEIAFFDGVDHRVRHARGGHFRLQIVRWHFRRGDEDTLFAGKRFFDAAIEEIGDVRVFFGFRDAQILEFAARRKRWRGCARVFPARECSAATARSSRIASWRRRRDFSGARDRRILSKPGSMSALVIWRARSARKLKKMTASSSRIRPRGTAGFPGAASVVITAGITNSSVTPFS